MIRAHSRIPVAADRQLELPVASNRLVALLRERQRLLTKVGANKRKVGDLMMRVDARNAELAQLAAKLAPLFDEAAAIDADIHALFAVLHSKKGLKRGQRRVIADLYEMLQAEGIIRPAGDDDAEVDDGCDSCSAGDLGADGAPPRPAREAASAKPAAGAKVAAVRELFRRLASAIHPDKASDARSQAERTEVMKEVTSAYQEGDLARLLELEKAWLEGDTSAVGHEGDDADRRCANLERINRELKAQLRAQERRLRELRNALSYDPLAPLAALGLVGPPAAGASEAEALVREQLAPARELRDFVRSFVDGKLSFDEFMAGPLLKSPDDELEEALTDDEFRAFLGDLALDLVMDGPRPSRKRRKKRS